MGKVRILNTTTQRVKFVEPHIGNDEKLLKTYGFIKQDHAEKHFLVKNIEDHLMADFTKTGEALATEIPLEYMEAATDLAVSVLENVTIDNVAELKAKYTELTGKKPGIKKPETLLKEIKELETKQD